MNNYQAIGMLAPQPNGFDVEMEEVEQNKETFPKESSLIVNIFQRLHDGDKLSFAQAAPFIREALEQNIELIPHSLSADDVNRYADLDRELATSKEKLRAYKRCCPTIPQKLHDCALIGKFASLGASGVSSSTTVGTAITGCCKVAGACACCVGTTASYTTATVSLGVVSALFACCFFGFKEIRSIKKGADAAQDQIERNEQRRQDQIDQLNAKTQFQPLPEQQPALLRMNDLASQRDRILKDYSIPTEPTERSKLIAGVIRMTDE